MTCVLFAWALLAPGEVNRFEPVGYVVFADRGDGFEYAGTVPYPARRWLACGESGTRVRLQVVAWGSPDGSWRSAALSRRSEPSEWASLP